jgi:hypothetical protein
VGQVARKCSWLEAGCSFSARLFLPACAMLMRLVSPLPGAVGAHGGALALDNRHPVCSLLSGHQPAGAMERMSMALLHYIGQGMERGEWP